MTRRRRIAYGRIVQETHAFSPVPSTMEDFRRFHLMEGKELARACSVWGSEGGAMIRSAELSGFVKGARRVGGRRVSLEPLLSAWAVPSGPITSETVEELRERMLVALRRVLPVDGIFLSMHGAMRGEAACPEPEEEFLRAIREVVGDELPIGVSLDLHGQLTPAKVDATTFVAGYRTNPHWDLARTGARAGEILTRTVLGEVRPTVAWRALPMVMGGGPTIDLMAPMRSIFWKMKKMERDPRVLYVTLFMCHIWNDSPDLGWSVHVVTDDAPELAEELAEELANLAWGVRKVRPPAFSSPDEAIALATDAWVARRLGAVTMVDASDVVGAGATGENTHLLRALLERARGLRSYVSIRDARAIVRLEGEAEGSRVKLEVGGSIDPVMYPPLTVEGVLVSRADMGLFGRGLHLDLGHVQLVVTEFPPYSVKPSFWSDIGLSPWRADVIVVKSLFHYRLYYAALNRKAIYVKTRGLTDLDMVERVEFNDPVWPLFPLEEWHSLDRKRRGIRALPQGTPR